MIRGRLVEINGKPLDTSRYTEERARHLAEREFNLSVADNMQQDNQIVAGRWWRADEHGKLLLSLEEGIAKTLGLHLNDQLTYDIAGQRITLTVQSLRKVEWDTMRANFFAVVPPGVLEKYPSSFITSFHLPVERDDVLNRLVHSHPNLTVIDIEAILSQVRAIMDRMTPARGHRGRTGRGGDRPHRQYASAAYSVCLRSLGWTRHRLRRSFAGAAGGLAGTAAHCCHAAAPSAAERLIGC
jgi:putative ABC transport system permease protein